MARVLAISNQKGGVGKTTTTINLSAALCRKGKRVLVVDLDPQGNASSGLGWPRSQVQAGLYDVLFGERSFDEVRLAGGQRLDLLAATRDLVGAELELSDQPDRDRRLRKVLSGVRERYDYVLIDCPPSLGLLTLNALGAADGVLIPLQAEYYAMEGLSEILRTIGLVRQKLNPDLSRDGVVLTMMDARNNLCREVERQVREAMPDEVFTTSIPRNVRLGEAPSFGKPIVDYDVKSPGAKAYLALADEFLAREGARLATSTPALKENAS